MSPFTEQKSDTEASLFLFSSLCIEKSRGVCFPDDPRFLTRDFCHLSTLL